MAESRSWFRGARRLVRSATLLPALIALVVMVVAGVFADRQNNQVAEERLRAAVTADLSLIRTELEGDINGNIQLVRGLVSVVASEPDMGQERFEAVTANIIETESQLRSLALAPDMVISAVAPLAGNEAALGFDYRRDIAQRDAAMRVLREGRMVLAGPLDLVQGGRGFVARFPVYTGPPDAKTFWGLVAAVIDVDALYADSGLLDEDLPLDLMLMGRDGLGSSGRIFLGDVSVLMQRPVIATVDLPTGSWQIAAVPKAGWHQTPENAWSLRAAIIVAGLLVVLPIGAAGILMEERQENVRKLRLREAQLAKLSQRLRLALDTSKVGVWEMDIETRDLVWDTRMNELFGMPDDAQGRHYHHWRDALHPDDANRCERDLAAAFDLGHYSSEFRLVLKSGEVRNIRAIGTVFAEPDAPPRIIGVNWDVTADVTRNEDLKRAKTLTEARNRQLEVAKARIEHNALHDSLTGLPNRRYLDQMLLQRASLRANGASVALLHIDLDRFKQINDTMGHAAGDALLVHVARILTATVAQGDFVARIGGDEFVVVCSAANGEPALTALAQRIIDQMRVPVAYEGHECRCGVSVGIAVEDDLHMDARRLLVNADIALYRAKARGRNRFEFFTAALEAEVVTSKRLADEILAGLERQEFLPHYQPQFDAQTHEIAGVEALARWAHPVDGLRTPDKFLRIAEDLNVVASIDREIMERALRDIAAWNRAGFNVPRVSVNVSLRRLHDEGLIASMRELDFTPGQLSFELVESIFLDESHDLVSFNIDQLKELGVDIEIDDFGTGYASIVSLQNLKPKRLKIDRQLVDPIVNSRGQRKLLASIVEIGRSLDIEVLAEGVETMQHAAILADLGCNVLQGYAFARPMSEPDLRAFLVAAPWRRAS